MAKNEALALPEQLLSMWRSLAPGFRSHGQEVGINKNHDYNSNTEMEMGIEGTHKMEIATECQGDVGIIVKPIEKQVFSDVEEGGNSTFYHALINCVSLLYGLGILSSPYAVAHAGWAGVGVSLAIAFTYWCAAVLVCKCMQRQPKLRNYQDVAEAAFGKRGRFLVTLLFYAEIFGTLVGYTISIGDNLECIFPHMRVAAASLPGKDMLILAAALIILPTVWFRKLSALSFTTVWAVVSTVVLLVAVLLAATVNEIGFKHPIPVVRASGVPVAAGLYAFSYGGTAVFPSVYKSMKDPSRFVLVTVISFAIAIASIAGLGVLGAFMFGPNTRSQVTLSMPPNLIATKVVLWMTVITPITKFALILSPVTSELESLLPWNRPRRREASQPPISPSRALFHHFMGTLMRSFVLAFIIIVAMALPYFNYIVALIGSSMTIMICMILPCIFYLKIFYVDLHRPAIATVVMLITFGALVAVAGTITSFHGLIHSKSGGDH